MIPFAMSLDRDEGVFSARSRANRKEVFERPTSSKASKVVVAKAKMASRGVGKSQLWCRKLDTRTSRYESSVGTRVCWSGPREVTAAQVAGGSDRPAGGACVCRERCPAWAGARGGGGSMTAVAAAVGCSGMGSEVRGVGLVHLGQGVHRGGSGAFMHLERAQSGFALSNLLF